MILSCFKNIEVFAAKDYPMDNQRWAHEIIRKVGNIDIVYAGENKLVSSIFRRLGFRVRLSRRLFGISGTMIRNLIYKGEDWKQYVPSQVYEYIIQINGQKKIKKCFDSESQVK